MKRLLTGVLGLLFAFSVTAQAQLGFFRPVPTVASSGPSTNAIWTGVVFYLRLDESSGTRVDATPNALDFTAVNTPTQTAVQITNAVLIASTGTKYLSRAYDTKFDGRTNFSVTLWTTNNNVSGNKYLFSKSQYATSVNYLAYLESTTGKIVFGTEPSSTFIKSIGGVTNNVPLFLTMVYDGNATGNTNRMKIYINGADSTTTGSGTIPASRPDTDEPFFIGALRQNSSALSLFDGGIDEFAFFSRTLSAAEVLNLYQSYTNGISYPY